MSNDEVLLKPCDEMIFECPLDDLVEKIGRQQLMDVGIWKVVCERL
jgi:hypothetical protein